eukprot:TRINITY_DN4914_c1_g1_i1.p1 TRINITY_DN4914_c1_g1~~TRINITY_DN4914_c1_g1_i1.p1  ORF type:complete len:238 (+),score=19.56 TRINITY_DN4914_c1_g1_i1:66-716(+)
METWTVEEVCMWLDNLGGKVASYRETFRRHLIDGTVLVGLTEKDLKNELSVAELGVRRTILRGVVRAESEAPVRNLSPVGRASAPVSSATMPLRNCARSRLSVDQLGKTRCTVGSSGDICHDALKWRRTLSRLPPSSSSPVPDFAPLPRTREVLTPPRPSPSPTPTPMKSFIVSPPTPTPISTPHPHERRAVYSPAVDSGVRVVADRIDFSLPFTK